MEHLDDSRTMENCDFFSFFGFHLTRRHTVCLAVVPLGRPQDPPIPSLRKGQRGNCHGFLPPIQICQPKQTQFQWGKLLTPSLRGDAVSVGFAIRKIKLGCKLQGRWFQKVSFPSIPLGG